MTAWPGTAYRYFAVDSADDISTDVLTLGVDGSTYPVTGEYVSAPTEEIAVRLAAVTPAPPEGTVRYWWRAITGTGTQLPLKLGLNTVYGVLTDLPEVLPHKWRFSVG